jgi:tetratricopeptide (TPR) repeat protein
LSDVARAGLQDARQRLQQAVDAAPQQHQDRVRLGRVLRDLGATDLARAAFKQVPRTDPNSVDATIGLAWCDLDEDKADAALALLGDARDVAALLGRGIALISLDRGDEAESLLADAVRLHPSDARARSAQAYLLIAAGDAAGAQRQLQALTAADPADSTAWQLLSLAALVQDERALALDAAQRAVASAPDSANAHIYMSYARQSAFDIDGAIRATEAALALDPANTNDRHHGAPCRLPACPSAGPSSAGRGRGRCRAQLAAAGCGRRWFARRRRSRR